MATSPDVVAAYLVLARVHLLGGEKVTAVDAFRAESEDIAENYARNLFIQGEGGVTVYGGCSFYPGTIAAIETEVIAVLDENHSFNAVWVSSMDVFDDFLEREEKRGQMRQQYDET